MEITILYWYWLVAAGVLLALEAAAPLGIFLWFGLAAVVLGGVSFLSPGLAPEAQLVAYGVLALCATVAWRFLFLRHRPRRSETVLLNQRGRRYVGRSFALSHAIEHGVGEIRVDDTIWRVRGEDAAAGSVVEVVGVDGADLLVHRKATD
jgi:hypothetical protein